MKTYEERLSMIDAAIECHVGKWPEFRNADRLVIDHKHNEKPKYYTRHRGWVSTQDKRWEEVCTRTEFEARARELGWVDGEKVEPSVKFIADQMKILTPNGEYRDMLELIEEGLNKMHNNNWHERGELPPVGTECRVRSKRFNEPLRKCKVLYIGSEIGVLEHINGNEYTMKIAECDFQPLRTKRDVLVEEGLNQLNTNQANCDDSLTHGEKCEVYNVTEWLPAKFIANDPDGLGSIFKTKEGYVTYTESRPLRTERDVLLEQIEKSFESTGCVFTNDHRALAEHLIEQGYRKIMRQSEGEFAAFAQRELKAADFSWDQLVKLYRDGCRFVDVGDV